MSDDPSKTAELHKELLRSVGAPAVDPPPAPARPSPAVLAPLRPPAAVASTVGHGGGGRIRRVITGPTPQHPPAPLLPVGRTRISVRPSSGQNTTLPRRFHALGRSEVAAVRPGTRRPLTGTAAAGTPVFGSPAFGTPAFGTPTFGTSAVAIAPAGPRPDPAVVMTPPSPIPADQGKAPLNPAASSSKPESDPRHTPPSPSRPAASPPGPTPPSPPLPSPVIDPSRRPTFVAPVPQNTVFGDDSDVEGDEPGDVVINNIPEEDVLDSSTLLNEPLLQQWREECRLFSRQHPEDTAITPTPNLDSPFVEAFQARADYSELCATVHYLAQEIDGEALRGLSKANFYKLMRLVLLRMDTLVLEVVLGGNLMKAYHDGPPSFRRQVDILHVLGRRSVPVIYLRLHTDDKGDPPTPAEYYAASQRMRRYVTGRSDVANDLAWEIDSHIANWPEQFSAAGIRRYMRVNPGAKPKTVAVEQAEHKASAAERIIAFCELLDAETEALRDSPQYSQPCARPKAYVGWARYSAQRLKSHNKHSTSSMLMGLMESTCAVLFPERNYRMRAFVVGLIGDAREARVAEVFFSLVTDSYAKTGGGFAASDAGISADSAQRVKAEHYNIYVGAMMKETRFHANLKRLARGTQSTAIQKAQEELEQKQAQLEKLKDDAYQLRQEIAQAAIVKLERSQESLRALREFEQGMRNLAAVKDIVEEKDVAAGSMDVEQT